MKRVLFVMQWYNYQTHKGIAQYAGEHGWHLNARMVVDGTIPYDWDGDGIITAEPKDFPGIGPLIRNTSAQVAYLSSRTDGPHHPSICLDHREIATVAADYLAAKGHRRYLCYLNEGSRPARMRYECFLDSIKERGGTVELLRIGADWIKRVEQVRRALEGRTFPLAVYSLEDNDVSDLTEACALEGLRVPEDVAILGTNNDEALCMACGVPVSSVECNLRDLGYAVAALLDRHMDDPSLAKEHHVLRHSPYVAERRSTETMAVDDPAVAKALRLVNDHFTEPIQIADLVKEAGVSRAGLFNAFKSELGRTPGQEITRLRLERAKHLLLHTDEGMDGIAYDAGFQTAQNMYVVFKKQLGMGPTAYRKLNKE